MSKLSYKTLFIIFFFLLIGVVVLSKFILPNQKVSAAWWNDMWMYRKAISITNSSGGNLTDFQVSLSIGTSALIASGKMQSDCDDIRITDINGNLLPYWIEPTGPNSCNQITDTKIWVKANSLPTSGTTAYFYYGNSSATIASSGQNTFIYFKNNFQTSDLGWNWSNGGVESGWAKTWANSSDSPGSTMTWIKNIINITGQEIIVEFTVKATKSGATGHDTTNVLFNPTQITSLYNNTNNSTIANGSGNSIITFGDYSGWHGKVGFDAGTGQASNITNDTTYPTYQFNTNGWVRHVHKLTNSSLLLSGYSLGGLSVGSSAWTYNEKTITAGYTKPNNIILAIGEQYNESIWLREAFVRKYASADPTPILQSEEVGTAPIAYWKFDEGIGTTAYDSTSNQNNGIFGTGSSAPTWADESQCISGKCLKFDGIDDYIDSNLKYPNKNTDYEVSASAWVKLTSSNGYRFIVGGINGGRADLLINNSNLAECRAFDSSDHIATGTTNLNDGKWHHISCVSSRKTSNFTKLYVDGKLESTIDYSSTIGYIENIKISAGASAGKIPFNGFIDDVKIYPYARTSTQIKLDYNAGKAHASSSKGTSTSLGSNKNNGDLSDGLVTYWKMDEGVGTSITDSSGNNKIGTLSGTGWINGKYGIGTSFAGAQSITIGTSIFSVNNASQPYTISTWIKTNSTSTDGIVTQYSSSSPSNRFGFRLNSGGFAWWKGGSNLAVSTTNINDNNWHHIVGTKDSSGNIKLYLDGNVNGNGGTDTLAFDNFSTQIGTFNGAAPYTGLLDEIRIYNRALSPSEVSDLYNYAPGPVGYWDFNESTGNIAKDKSGNGLNGTITGAIWTQGKIGSGLKYSTTNDYVYISSLSKFSGTGTISMWVKWTGSGFDYFFDQNEHNFLAFTDTNGIRYYPNYGADNTDSLIVNNIYWDQNWHYLTFTADDTSNLLQIYFDGILKGSASPDWSAPTINNFTLGAISSYRSSYNFDGKIDEVKIYNYVRTQKQIIEDMNSGAPAISSKSMVAYYKFDEGNGTTISNWGNGGIGLSGIFGAGSSAPTWTDGKSNKALSFDGSDYVRLFNSTLDSIGASGDFTITAWNKQDSFSGIEVILGQGFAGAPGGHTFGRWQVGTNGSKGWISLYGGSSSPSYKQLTGATNLLINAWNQIIAVFSRSEGKLKLYINGKFDSQLTWDGYIENVFANRVVLGYNSGTNDQYMNGLVDEVKIYNYALTSEEIKQDYNQGSALQMGQTSQTIGATTTNLEYCIPGDTSYCASPVAEYKMDEGLGTSTVDTSGNNLSAGFSGSTPTWVQGKVGKALSFDGIDDTLDVPDLNFTGPFTYSFWLNNGTNIGTRMWSSGSGSQKFGMLSSKFFLRVISSTDNTVSLPSQNNWHHISLSRNSSDKIDLYVDGVATRLFGDIGQSGTTFISVFGRDNDGSGQFYQGKIDHIKIYNYARTPAQIAYDYNKGAPVGWWKFDECQGNIAYDWSGISNTGTINIGASGTQNSLGTCQIGTSAAWTNGSTGKINSSLNFDGIDDYVDISNNPTITSASPQKSITAWIKVVGGENTWRGIVSHVTSGFFHFQIQSTNKLEIYFYGPGKNAVSNILFNSNNYNKWFHVVGVWDGTYAKLYINGIEENISTAGSGLVSNATSNVYIGNGYTLSRPFNGQIDDVRIYNYALTSEQIKTIYNGGAVSFN